MSAPRLTILLFLILPASAFANPGRGGPPQEAVQACEGAQENDTCAFEGRRGEVEGVCAAGPRADLPLACRPDDAPPQDGQRRGPPAEAIEACEGQASGDRCDFSHGERELSGTCSTGPEASAPLACMPDDAPRR